MEAKQPNPTPEEIRAACEEIQRRWTAEIRQSRAVRANAEPESSIPVYGLISHPDGVEYVPENGPLLAPSGGLV